MAQWVGAQWRRGLIGLAVVMAAAFLILTKVGHHVAEVVSVSMGLLGSLAAVYMAYNAWRKSNETPGPVEAEPAGLVFVCFARGEDLRWAHWLEDRLGAAGFTGRIQQLPSGQDPAAIHGWAREVSEEAACVLVVVTQALVNAGPSAALRLAAVAAHPRGGDRLLMVSAVQSEPALQVGARHWVSIEGIRQEKDAWAIVEQAILDRGARSSARSAASFGARTVAFPGKGVTRANLPAPNPYFIGRASELAFLHETLVEQPGSVTERTVAIHAMSGMGKTQLAIQFANSVHEFETVWWIRAHQQAAIYEDLTSLALKLELPEMPDQGEMLRRLWDRLRDVPRWLLVYDNAEEEEKIRGLIPPAGDGAVLITSLSPNWSPPPPRRLELGLMSETDSLELLRRRIVVRDDQVLAQIAEQLGWLPLALEQAASYMRETQCTPKLYLKLLSRRFSETLEAGTQAYYDKSASTTFRMARELTAKQEPLSGLLMELCAFFSPDAIPRDLLEDPEQAEALPDDLAQAIEGGIRYNAAISVARKLSLLTVTPTSFTMHRVVQKLIRDSLTRAVRKERAAVALKLLARAFPGNPDDARNWATCGALQNHCETALSAAVEYALVSSDSIRLSRLIGEYLRARGAFEPALKRLTATLAQLEYQPDDKERAAVELALARVCYALADLGRAKEHAEIALGLHGEVFGTESPQVAAGLLELSQIRMELSEFDDAVGDAEQSLLIHLSADGAAMAQVGRSLEALGLAQWRLGAWAEATANLQECNKLLTAAFGADSGITARSRLCFGFVLRDAALGDAGRLEAAEREIEAAYRILVAAHGAEHPITVSAAIHLADTRHRVARARFRLDGDAERLGRDLLAIAGEFEEIMARLPMQVKGPDRGCGLVRQGHLLNNLGDHDRARELVQEAQGIYLQSYGPDHPYVAEALTRLIGIEYDLEHRREATRAANEARRIYVSAYGEGHPYIAQIDAFLRDPAQGGRD